MSIRLVTLSFTPDHVLHLLTPFTNAAVASFVKIPAFFSRLLIQYKNKMSLRVRIFEYHTVSEGLTKREPRMQA